MNKEHQKMITWLQRDVIENLSIDEIRDFLNKYHIVDCLNNKLLLNKYNKMLEVLTRCSISNDTVYNFLIRYHNHEFHDIINNSHYYYLGIDFDVELNAFLREVFKIYVLG